MNAVPSLPPTRGRATTREQRRQRRLRRATQSVPPGVSLAAARGALWLVTR